MSFQWVFYSQLCLGFKVLELFFGLFFRSYFLGIFRVVWYGVGRLRFQQVFFQGIRLFIIFVFKYDVYVVIVVRFFVVVYDLQGFYFGVYEGVLFYIVGLEWGQYRFLERVLGQGVRGIVGFQGLLDFSQQDVGVERRLQVGEGFQVGFLAYVQVYQFFGVGFGGFLGVYFDKVVQGFQFVQCFFLVGRTGGQYSVRRSGGVGFEFSSVQVILKGFG